MPLNAAGVHVYTEADSEATASDLLNLLSASVSARLPLAGNALVTPVANATVTHRVNFPAGRFTAPPIVTVTPVTGAPANCDVGVSGVSTSGFDITFWRNSVIATGVQWIAVPS